uniref:Uncharacterized protein n=1 Tax=Klebsiella phage FKP3 TaxID=3231233 RepID=A0AAU8I058_9CAUD
MPLYFSYLLSKHIKEDNDQVTFANALPKFRDGCKSSPTASLV